MPRQNPEPSESSGQTPPSTKGQRFPWLRPRWISLVPPEAFLDRQIDRLPKALRSSARACATFFYWLLFLDSATSLLVGRALVRQTALYAISVAPPAVRVVLTYLWSSILGLASAWALVVQQPLRQVLAYIDIDLTAFQFDLAAVLLFSLGATLRAWRLRTQLQRRILKSARPARRRPSAALSPHTFRRLLKRYSGPDLESDIDIVTANSDKLIVGVMRAITFLEPFNSYQEPIINVSIIIGRAFPQLDREGIKFGRFDREVYVPVMQGTRLTAAQRDALAAGLDDAVPYLFEGDIGNVFFKAITTLFAGTTAERNLRRSSERQLVMVIGVTAIVLGACIADLLLTLP
jgi:hypothetical protein